MDFKTKAETYFPKPPVPSYPATTLTFRFPEIYGQNKHTKRWYLNCCSICGHQRYVHDQEPHNTQRKCQIQD